MNEFGLSATVASDCCKLDFSSCLSRSSEEEAPTKENGVHLVVNMEMPTDFQEYLFKISKMTRFGCVNFIINLVTLPEMTKIQEMVAIAPLHIHPMPDDIMTWRDAKKLRAYIEQQTKQLLHKEENKSTISSKALKPIAGQLKKSTNLPIHSASALTNAMKVLNVTK